MYIYLYYGELLCEECGKAVCKELTDKGEAPTNLDDEHTWDSDDFPKGPYRDGGGEADTPQHCGHCNVFLRNPLTDDGYRYVVDEIQNAAAKGNLVEGTVAYEWYKFYDVEL